MVFGADIDAMHVQPARQHCAPRRAVNRRQVLYISFAPFRRQPETTMTTFRPGRRLASIAAAILLPFDAAGAASLGSAGIFHADFAIDEAFPLALVQTSIHTLFIFSGASAVQALIAV